LDDVLSGVIAQAALSAYRFANPMQEEVLTHGSGLAGHVADPHLSCRSSTCARDGEQLPQFSPACPLFKTVLFCDQRLFRMARSRGKSEGDL
jgi:hypothetical protein